MSDKYENFRVLAATDARIADRYAENAAHLTKLANELLDVDVDVESLIEVDALRVSAITGEFDTDRAVLEVSRLAKVAALRAEREQAEKVKAGDAEAMKALYKFPPGMRMARSREMGLSTDKPKASSIADPKVAFEKASGMRPADRISYLRGLGLI